MFGSLFRKIKYVENTRIKYVQKRKVSMFFVQDFVYAAKKR